jgi:hypothetical protein
MYRPYMGTSNEPTSDKWVGIFEAICAKQFGTSAADVVQSLLLSPNARGYILGSLSELLLARHFSGMGFQVKRIKEKWVGEKLHHGDFYVSRNGTEWYVIESKGLKSNSERWHKINAIDPTRDAVLRWFEKKRSGEFLRWWQSLASDRREKILESGQFPRARILETHFVSGTGGRAGREIATPRINEFHVVALDLHLRTGLHEWAFAAAQSLEPAESNSSHLKQNYLIDIMIPTVDDEPNLVSPWTRDFSKLFDSLQHPVKLAEMQADLREPGEREADVSEVLSAIGKALETGNEQE